LLSAPSNDADRIGQLPADAEVQVTGQVSGDSEWLQLRAPTGRAGYVPLAAIEEWSAWARRNTVTGRIDAIEAHYRPVINGRVLPQAGIQTPDPARANSAWLAMEDIAARNLVGKQAICEPLTTMLFMCKADGRRVPEYFIFNGAATVLPGYPLDRDMQAQFLEVQRQSQERGVGAWRPQ
jgi:hypothetical protein